MRLSTTLCVLLAFGPAACAAVPAATTPTIFAPGSIAGDADDGAAAFTPDGATVYFMRGTDSFTLMASHRTGGHWSAPQVAPFSGRWRDLDPAMAPDGSYLLFVSNRPTEMDGQPLDATHAGKRRSGQGMNLWRVDRLGDGWGTPRRLPDIVNACSMTFAPSIAADGSVYFIGCAAGDSLRLQRSAYRDGHYLAPVVVPMGDADMPIRDPAIAPDGSFMVVSTQREAQQPYRLAITFHTAQGWSTPLDLGDIVNGGKHSMGAQLGPDHRTLYFYSDRRLPPNDPDGSAAWNNGDDHIWHVSLAPWLDAAQPSIAPVAQVPWHAEHDASLAFAPDRKLLFFARGRGESRRILVADRPGDTWSAARPASFSDAWMDMEPAMAPDGSYLVFASNRSTAPGGAALDGYYDDQPQARRGGNLWRVNRRGNGWSTPVHLPETVNSGTSVYAPAVAADGSIYFMKADPATSHFRLYVSHVAEGRLQPATPLAFSDGVTDDYDPAVAPDQSFIVFTSDRSPSSTTASDIFIAVATPGGWSRPVDLGVAGTESRLDPDLSTLYFSGSDQRVQRFALQPWLAQHATLHR
ncbi:TolB family protein [Rhodanobacter sp. Col0626]|uniref:TolB family protein n=1 Tax=Rhodanobacter sp. Col0626 TaxID=3415679 RepID=UPI003CEB638A